MTSCLNALGYVCPLATDYARTSVEVGKKINTNDPKSDYLRNYGGAIYEVNARRIWSKRLIGALLSIASVATILIAVNVIPNQFSFDAKMILLGTACGGTVTYWLCLGFKNLQSRSILQKLKYVKHRQESEPPKSSYYFTRIYATNYIIYPLFGHMINRNDSSLS